jgi:hypothetical protein
LRWLLSKQLLAIGVTGRRLKSGQAGCFSKS